MLIVNVACKCGFTPQYEGLEALQRNYQASGFTVAGFPCNQFRAQEPGDAEEIANFCKLTYDVSFPVMGKIDVNGDRAAPMYRHLKDEAPGLLAAKAIKWNFTKFLVDRSRQGGEALRRRRPSPRTWRATSRRCSSDIGCRSQAAGVAKRARSDAEPDADHRPCRRSPARRRRRRSPRSRRRAPPVRFLGRRLAGRTDRQAAMSSPPA